VLNEVAIQPNQVVELYNTASTSADISSWYIDDASGSTYYTIPSQTILAPRSCLLFSADFNFNKSSADTVRLFDNIGPPTSTSAKLVESYSYPRAHDSGYSFIKKPDGGSEWQASISSLGLFNESLTSCVPSPTPTPSPTETATLFPTSTPIPDLADPTPIFTISPTPQLDFQNIYISEVLPYPESNNREWIELYNDNDIQVNLDHWYIDDGENTGSTPKSFSLKIDPYSYVAVDLSSSLFNNTGDVVRLLNNYKEEKDSMEYGKVSQGKSMGCISFLEDTYCEQSPSKGTANMSCLLEPVQSSSSQYTQSTIGPTQKTVAPTIKPVHSPSQQVSIITSLSLSTSQHPNGEVLGVQIRETLPTSPTPYLSFVSTSYSLLTIVSLFIKMKNA
jgi:hypothetical protein